MDDRRAGCLVRLLREMPKMRRGPPAFLLLENVPGAPLLVAWRPSHGATAAPPRGGGVRCQCGECAPDHVPQNPRVRAGFVGTRAHQLLLDTLLGAGLHVRQLVVCPSQLGVPYLRPRCALAALWASALHAAPGRAPTITLLAASG